MESLRVGARRARRQEYDYYDYPLIADVILLIAFGLVMLYSASAYTAEQHYGNDMYLFLRQLGFTVISFALCIPISRLDFFDYHVFERIAEQFNYVAFLLMLLVQFTPLGVSVNGARRWLGIGPLRFQPAEVAKIAVILYTPVLIRKMGRNFRGFKGALIGLLPAIIQALGARFLTDNLSTAIIIFLVGAGIVFVAHPSTWQFLAAAGALIGIAAVGVLVIASRESAGASGTNFRAGRILVWLHPEQYARDGGWQILQGLYALGSGGLLGKGLGNSTQKLGAVPEAENDMIFSIICEELGVVGCVFIVCLFIYLLYRLYNIARNAPDRYGSLIVTGVFVHIAAQVVLNIAVALNLIPTTGVTLPFISYGGTSVFFLMAEIGIALSVSRQITHGRKKDLWGDVVDTTY